MQFSLSSLMNGRTAEQGIQDSKTADLLPSDNYVIALTNVDVKHKQRLNAADGVMNTTLLCTFTVQEGQYKGRLLSRSVAVDHNSSTFMNLSMRFVSQLAKACGHKGSVDDLGIFMYKPVLAKVTVKQDKDPSYGPKNEIASIDALGAGPMPAAPRAAYAPPPPVAAAPTTAPVISQPVHAATQPPAGPALAAGGTPPWKQG